MPAQAREPLFAPTTLDEPHSCAEKVRHVQWSELPLSCPMPGDSLWNAHPRVYLAIHRTGKAQCGYCGTTWVLDDPPLDQPDPIFANTEIEKNYRQAQERVRASAAKK